MRPSASISSNMASTASSSVSVGRPPKLSMICAGARPASAASEPGSTFQCSIDGAAYTTCNASLVTTTLADGSHTISVRATDAAGNTDATPATYTWTITGLTTTVTDGPAFIPPEDPIEPATGGETTSTTAVLVFEANVADDSGAVQAVWFNQAYLAERLHPGARLVLNGRLGKRNFAVKTHEIVASGGGVTP